MRVGLLVAFPIALAASGGCQLIGGITTDTLADDGGSGSETGPGDDGGADAEAGSDDGGPRSCQSGAPGAGNDCGPNHDADCCASTVIDGGLFKRSNDPAYPATVSPFRLDVYEVTVGRFKEFIQKGYSSSKNPPPPDAGANPHIPNSGWLAIYQYYLSPGPTSALPNTAWYTIRGQGVPGQLAGCSYYTFDLGDPTLPMNCISWVEAFAFCAWDGGRLPTEAEWNFAAAGGSDGRVYPWSSPPSSTSIDGSDAVYCHSGNYVNDAGAVVDSGTLDYWVCSLPSPASAGSTAAHGAGRWGQADLGGNMGELVLDSTSVEFPPTSDYPMPCNDCASYDPSAPKRILRGGSFYLPDFASRTDFRAGAVLAVPGYPFGVYGYNFGIRCARSP